MSILIPSQSVITAGQMFHGYKLIDGTYEDLFGRVLEIPPGVTFSANDGGWCEIDFGLPEIDGVSTTSILTGWNGYAKTWNGVRGVGGLPVQISQTAWLYRSSAGIVWVLWVVTSSWEIRAHRVYAPELYYPSNAHPYAVVGTIPAMNDADDMGPSYASGFNFSCAWVNQSKTGRRAAIHRYSKNASGFNLPSSIVEVIVGDNGGDSPPFVDVATYTKGCTREETVMPKDNYWSVFFNVVNWNTYADEADIYWSPFSVEVDNGTAKDYLTYSYVIVYDKNESPQRLQHQIRADYTSTVSTLGSNPGSGHYVGTISGMDGVPSQPENCYISSVKEIKEWLSINGNPVRQIGYSYTESSTVFFEPLATTMISTGTSSGSSGIYDRVIPIHGKALIAVPRNDTIATEYIMPIYTDSSNTPVTVRGFITGTSSSYSAISPMSIVFSNMCIDYHGTLNPTITRRF